MEVAACYEKNYARTFWAKIEHLWGGETPFAGDLNTEVRCDTIQHHVMMAYYAVWRIYGNKETGLRQR